MELKEAKQTLLERLDRTPIVVSVKRPDDPDNDDYQDILNKLKTIEEIERFEQEINLRADEIICRREESDKRLAAELERARVEDRKSKRDLIGKLSLAGISGVTGFGAIMLTGALESERFMRSKAWQFASKLVSKVL